MSGSTQKNAFTDESPSASEDDADATTDTVNEGSKHIVLGDRDAEKRIQRARDARKEFFESEHNTTVESYSSKRDEFDNDDERSDNEDIPLDDPEKVTSVKRDLERSQEKTEGVNVAEDGGGSVVKGGQPFEQETISRDLQKTGSSDLKDKKDGRSRMGKNKQKREDSSDRQEAVRSGKSRTGSLGRDGDAESRGEVVKSGKGGRESGESRRESGKGRLESGGSVRSGANSSSSASEANKQ